MTDPSVRWRVLHAVVAAAAIVVLFGFAHALRPSAVQTSIASGALPLPAASDDVVPDDDADTDTEADTAADLAQEQQEQAQAQASIDQQVQQQLQANEQQAENDAMQAAEQQNEQAQAQANQDIFQAEQSDPQLIQNSQQG